VGGLIFGPMMQATSVTLVLAIASVVAAGLVAVAHLNRPAPAVT
jgi:hypothetical protein